MTSTRETSRGQTAVLWASIGTYNGVGEPVLGSPVEITLRAESGQFLDTSEEATPIGKTLNLFTDRLLGIDSQLWIGDLDDLPDDLTEEPLYRVVDNDTIPDLRGRFSEYTAVVARI